MDLKTFDFKFFRGLVNPLIFECITFDFNDEFEGFKAIRKLYNLDVNNLSEMDLLAIYLFNRYYENSLSSDKDKEILLELSKTKDPGIIELYTGKKYLSKLERNKLANANITLYELIKNGI